jgi:hypothetical protein
VILVPRLEAGRQTITAKAIRAAAGAAPEDTTELLTVVLPTPVMLGTRELPRPTLLETAGEPAPLNLLLALRGKCLSCEVITSLLRQPFLSEQFDGYNKDKRITRANGQY